MEKRISDKKSRNFIFRRYGYIRPIIDREKKDQEPCYYKDKYGEFEGFKYYMETVSTSVVEFIMYSLPDFHDMDSDEEENMVDSLLGAFDDMFFNEIEEYYFNFDCGEYFQNLSTIYESVSHQVLRRLRRIQEVRDTIEFQMEIQDPCDFEDSEEFADFCIGEGLSFFYGDENYEREDDVFADENDNEDSGREEIEQMMYEEYFDKLVKFWDEIVKYGNC